MGIQKYLVANKIKAALKRRAIVRNEHTLSEISDIAIFVDESSIFVEKEFRALQKIIKLDEIHFSILTFKEKKSSYNEFRGTVLYQNEINWRGNITSKDVKSYLKKKYDVLIDYTDADNLERQLIVTRINAKMKIGFSVKKKKFYDLLIAVEPNEIKLFNKELVRYLKILKLLE